VSKKPVIASRCWRSKQMTENLSPPYGYIERIVLLAVVFGYVSKKLQA